MTPRVQTTVLGRALSQSAKASCEGFGQVVGRTGLSETSTPVSGSITREELVGTSRPHMSSTVKTEAIRDSNSNLASASERW